MIFSRLFSILKKKISFICLIDRCLLIFMFILMGETAYNFLFPSSYSSDTNAVDVVIRTTSAAIFGYFISGGFLRGSSNSKPKQDVHSLSACDLSPQNSAFSDFENRSKQQIIIVSCIGGFSLLLLIFVQRQGEITQSTIAAASQLRDFVSGSVGLLIGHSTRDKM